MAWDCVVKHCVTKNGNAKHGIAQRRRTQHRTACHGMAPEFLEGNWIVFEKTEPVWSRGSMVSSLGSPKSAPQGGSAYNIAFSKQTREEGDDDDDDDDDDGGAAHRRPSGGRASGAGGLKRPSSGQAQGCRCRSSSAQIQEREESNIHIV